MKEGQGCVCNKKNRMGYFLDCAIGRIWLEETDGFLSHVYFPKDQVPADFSSTEAAGNPIAARAVGLACKNNPIPLIIPCHRVIGSGGDLVGFGGGLDIKKKLLDLEGRQA